VLLYYLLVPSYFSTIDIANASQLLQESYPGRRQPKDMEGWEFECLKFHKQLLKHPWISAERPKVGCKP
jgi:hypothetical protein